MLKNMPLEGLRDFGKRVSHEGMVLLKNDNNVLPLINEKVAIFGRIQTSYYKSGTGSGGLVNVTDVPSFIEAAHENPRIDINKEVELLYKNWVSENPFNAGNGMWASEPWSQEEMPISLEQISKLKRNNETAIMIIGRTAGEDRDNYYGKGSYLLTEIEYDVIKNLKQVYEKVVVVLNVGNVIDLNFVEELSIDSLLIAWHGGQDGARATMDILSGYINPSGKLPATIVKDLDKYPASKTFGDKERVEYIEDIYVGYRYFETFNKEDVIYPFGYGLSYTQFQMKLLSAFKNNDEISLKIEVENTGKISGKEVVQIYYEAPQGLLGKPKRALIAFAKTKLLEPNEKELIEISFEINNMKSYDDKGLINQFSYVLEKGAYHIYFGTSVRDLELGYTYNLEDNVIVEELSEALAPYESFERIVAKEKAGKILEEYEKTPQRTINLSKRIEDNLPKEIPFNNKELTLIDVVNKKTTIDEFVGSLSKQDLKTIVIGEGMSSPKVTPGTASAFAGVTNNLVNKKIPIICAADGPSGIRMDSGLIATSLPNGALIASTFNSNLVTKLYEFEGLEMKNYNIDVLLGPGMNIIRHPLNGRNFEYFSEDPLLTGIMASAVVKGLHNSGVFGAMKHLAANNQETARTKANSVVSERALREIYLKPFEIAVKSSDAKVIMTSYNPINGIWSASNYDLNTKILRDEWNFDGILITDWWAAMNNDNDKESKENLAAMVKSQNDIYMVTPNALEYKNNIDEKLNEGYLKISELQRSAKNIINFALKTETFKNSNNLNYENDFKYKEWFKTSGSIINIEADKIKTTFEKNFDESLIDKYDYIEQKGNITYAVKDNIIEVYGIKPKIEVNEFDEIFRKIPKDYPKHIFPSQNWDRVDFNLDSAIITKGTSFKETTKDAIYTFPVQINHFGKYIIELEISSNLPETTQMPFSIYANNKNKQTLTTNGTGGNKIKISAQIVIDTNTLYLSFKIHKTGIAIHNISVIKHG